MVKTMNVNNVMVLVAVVATTSILMLHATEAARYTVGDKLGWTIPPGGDATYAAWAAKHSLVVNDILSFNFVAGEHDLAWVRKEDFDSCDTSNPIAVFQTPGEYMFSSEITYYMTCTYAGHCSKGQKIALRFASTLTASPTQSQSDSVQHASGVKFVSKKEYSFKKLMSTTKSV